MSRSFPPAYLSGGPARSLDGLVNALASEVDFHVVTSAHDDSPRYVMPGIEPDVWVERRSARVVYLRAKRHFSVVCRALDTKPDVVYLNSLFDRWFSVLPLVWLRVRYRRLPVLLAPRGELSPGALAIRPTRKRLFIAAYRLLRLHHSVHWHASTALEEAEIQQVFGSGIRCHVGRDPNPMRPDSSATAPPRSGSGIVFFSRVVPKKNLLGLLRALAAIQRQFTLSIAGPLEDRRYWSQCERSISQLPNPDQVSYLGTVPADGVVDFLRQFDLFVLPTFGENFGHVVYEALAAGVPVIVGRDTPWQAVEESGAGWLCDPSDEAALAHLIERFLDLPRSEKERHREAARALARHLDNDQSTVETNRRMIASVVNRSQPT